MEKPTTSTSIQPEVLNQSDDIASHRRIFISRLLSGLARSAEASHVRQDSAGTASQESLKQSLSALGRRIGQRKGTAEQFAEHALALLKQRKNTLELAELPKSIHKATVHQDDCRSLALVVVGDLYAIKRCECLQ
jgi:hypothetical protein